MQDGYRRSKRQVAVAVAVYVDSGYSLFVYDLHVTVIGPLSLLGYWAVRLEVTMGVKGRRGRGSCRLVVPQWESLEGM